MEFHEKLQLLRKEKGLTQEELAQKLYVSRTAVSKWESGRGYPNINSLQEMAKFFSVTVDALLSGEALLTLAQQEHRERENRLKERVFALLDLSAVLFFVLPLFRENAADAVRAVSLVRLRGAAAYMRAAYALVIACMTAAGAGMLLGKIGSRRLSFILNAVGVTVCIVGSQPYAAGLLFAYLLIKGLMTEKQP